MILKVYIIRLWRSLHIAVGNSMQALRRKRTLDKIPRWYATHDRIIACGKPLECA